MSFFEVAGLVLAIIPLVCQGLDAYPDSFIVKIIRAKNEIKTFIEQLELIKSTLRTTMIEILRTIDAALTSDQLEVLKSPDISGSKFFDSWNEVLAANPEAITAQYGASRQKVQKVLDDMVEILAELTSIPREAAPELLRGMIENEKEDPRFSMSKRFLKSFKFAKSSNKRRVLLDRMEGNIKLMNQLNSAAGMLKDFQIQPSREESESSHRSFLEKARKYCDCLYDALRKAWKCECHKTPSAMLRLEKRVISEEIGLQFSLFLAYEHKPSMESQTCWSFQQTQVSVYEKSKKKARFAGYPDESDYKENLQSVENICEPLRCSHSERRACLELLLDQDRKLWEIDTGKDVAHVEIKQDCLSLDKILQSSDQQLSPVPPRRHRLSLAVNLAYSVLQLHTTPWLPRNWGIDCIYVPFESEVPQPHVVLNFDEATSELENPVDLLNPYLVALGIVLLEVWEWKSFQQWMSGRDDVKYRAENLIDVAGAATKWLAEREDQKRMIISYAQVVRRCLNSSFESRLTDEVLQGEVYRYIVKPLDAVYETTTNPFQRKAQ